MNRFPYTIEERSADLATMPAMEWWTKHDPDKRDPNWGRSCLLCDRAVPAGLRYAHTNCQAR